MFLVVFIIRRQLFARPFFKTFFFCSNLFVTFDLNFSHTLTYTQFISVFQTFHHLCRQNLNSDFTDSALGSSEKSPGPYGNFRLRDNTVQSILNNPKYGPRNELGGNHYNYLKFGLPRVIATRGASGSSGITPVHKDNSSGYDSTDEEIMNARARSVPPPSGLLRAAR